MTAAEGSSERARAWYFEDWINPVLLKEVRQALRGKYFKVCFWLTLLAVTVVTTGVLVVNGEDGHIGAGEGREFVFGVFFCLAVSAIGFVPFAAFNAMGAEWDENTFDLLIISNVRPHGIVLGKLLAAGVQTLIFYSAFTPYLVLSSLMQGVDLNAVALLLAGVLFFSSIFSVIAICLSTLSRVRFARVVLQAMLAVMLVSAVSAVLTLGSGVIEQPGVLHQTETVYVILVMVVPSLVVAAYAFGIACVMLSHPEENRSTGMRILTTACLLAVIGWIQAMVGFAPFEALWGMGIATLVALLVPMTFFVTEAETLPRRVGPRIPSQRLVALLASPYLPGGARGFLHFLLHLGLLLAFLLFVLDPVPGGVFGIPGGSRGAELALIGAMLYAVVYIGLPSAILAPFAGNPALRAAARASIPFLVAAFAFLPAVLGFFIDHVGLMQMRHAGNPVHLMLVTINRSPSDARWTWLLLLVLSVVTVIANVPRISRAFLDVARCSSARAAREAATNAARIGAGSSDGTHDAVA